MSADEDLSDFLWLDDAAPARPARRERTPATVRGGEDAHGRPAWPGEPGLWVFLLGDMTLFGVFFVAFLVDNRHDRAGFADSSHHLVRSLGVLNTLVLLTSSLLVVLALRAVEGGRAPAARALVTGALGCAAVFACCKALEWGIAFSDGRSPATDRFFLYYFVLTGVHLLHVVIGSGLLGWFRHRSADPDAWARSRVGLEGAAVYWHMVDLLWIAIFTLLYLVCVR